MTSPMTSVGESCDTVRITFVSATPSTSRRWDRRPENRTCSSRNHPDWWTGPSTSCATTRTRTSSSSASVAAGALRLIAQTAEPKKLVALELSDEPVQQLERFLDDTNRRATIHPYYGVDQADRATVSRILDDEFGTEPLDLVTDDASHLLDLTRTSFEMLFPRLRPGGTYIIEDWNWEHVRANAVAETLATEGSPGREAFNAELKARLADRSSPEYAAFETWYEAQATNPETPVVTAARTPTLDPRAGTARRPGVVGRRRERADHPGVLGDRATRPGRARP